MGEEPRSRRRGCSIELSGNITEFLDGNAKRGGIHRRVTDQMRLDLLKHFPQTAFFNQTELQERGNVVQVAGVPTLQLGQYLSAGVVVEKGDGPVLRNE